MTTPYQQSFLRRTKVILECGEKDLRNNYTERAQTLQAIQRALCAQNPAHFINTFCVTYDPREAAAQGLAFIPFDLWPRQEEFLTWLQQRVQNREEGLAEKSRDIGFTYLAAAYALNRWLFAPGFKTTFGSRKLDLVDKLGDPDSILEKVRLMLYRLPPWLHPPSFDCTKHDNWTKITNPDTGALISGEAGDNMGRGGRSTLFIIDEAAFVDHAESVNAAILANSDCRIWASSANGPGNLFARKRHDGSLRDDQIFTFTWDADPRKTPEWLTKKRRELAATPWIFASEYLIDYNASVEGICIPSAWVNAALELGKHPTLQPNIATAPTSYPGIAGLDIGDGVAESVYIHRRGPVVYAPKAWHRPDTTDTAYQALDAAHADHAQTLNFDTIGVGKGVLSTLTHRQQDVTYDAKGQPHTTKDPLAVNPVNTGLPASWQTKWPDGTTSRQKCANLKAELWWLMRERFRCAAEHLAHLTDAPIGDVAPQPHDADDLIIFDPAAPPNAFRELIVQLSAPKRGFTANGKIQLESKQQLQARGVASPDRAEALSLTFAPNGTAAPLINPANPVIVQGQKLGYPELASPHGLVIRGPGGASPAVKTGTRFDRDFDREW